MAPTTGKTDTRSPPWQLYLFSIAYMLAGIILILPICDFVFNTTCNATESVLMLFAGFGFLYLGLLFLVLTHINKDEAPKLKRLSIFALNVSTTTVASVILFGSSGNGGYEGTLVHILDMIVFFVLLVVVMTALMDSSPVAGSRSFRDGLGLNPKTIVMLFFVAALIKLFVMADYMGYKDFLNDAQDSPLADIMWLWIVFLIFQILFPFVFTIAYGDNQDQEAVTVAVLVLSYCGLFLIVYPHQDIISYGVDYFWVVFVGLIAFTALCLAAVWNGRKGQDRSGYERVENVIV